MTLFFEAAPVNSGCNGVVDVRLETVDVTNVVGVVWSAEIAEFVDCVTSTGLAGVVDASGAAENICEDIVDVVDAVISAGETIGLQVMDASEIGQKVV